MSSYPLLVLDWHSDFMAGQQQNVEKQTAFIADFSQRGSNYHMEQLSLYKNLNISCPLLVSIFGGGGKSTFLSTLSSELAEKGLKSIITTTTKFFPFPGLPHIYLNDKKDPMGILGKMLSLEPCIVVGDKLLDSGKINGIDLKMAARIRDELNVTVIVEADGSQGKPIKGYAPHEPVLPPKSDLVVAIVGADALGRSFDNRHIHRPEFFKNIPGLSSEHLSGLLDEKAVALAFREMYKIAHKQVKGASFAYMINKDSLLPKGSALKLFENMKCLLSGGILLITELQDTNPVRGVFSLNKGEVPVKIAAVVLAAGLSRRMGENKLNLPFGGRTVLEESLFQIVKSDVDEVILVTRPDNMNNLHHCWEKIKVVDSPRYREGQSRSMQAGLLSVSPQIQGILFALADQPLLPAALYNRIIQAYRSSLPGIALSLHGGVKGNPVIFDRRTWPDLLSLEGDQGGRALVNKTDEDNILYVESGFDYGIIDIDTENDYHAALEIFHSRKGL